MKKSVLIVLMLVLAVSMVFARAGQDSSGKTTVRLGLWPPDDRPDEIAMHRRFVSSYNQLYPNVELVPAHYFYALETVIPMAEAGRLPTIFEPWFTEPEKLISNGFVKDVTDEVRALGWENKMNPTVRDMMTRNGRIYGVPRDAYALGIHLNVDLFRKAGLVDANGVPQYPKTWEELARTAQTIKQKTGADGLCLLAKDNAGGWHFTNIAWGFGANFIVKQGGKWVAQVNSPEAIAALQYVKDLKWTYDVLTADPTNEDWGTGWQAIGTGRAAMYIGANDGVNMSTEVNGLPVRDLALIPVPAGPRGQFSLGGGTIYMFPSNATSEQVTAAMHYLEFMGKAPFTTPESQQSALAGITEDARSRNARGVPVINEFPSWIDPAYISAKEAAAGSFNNVDNRFFADYFATVSKPGNLRLEEGGEANITQDLYAELTKALQAVLTDRNANPQTLLNTAQQNVQRLLDQNQ
ncbi:MAG: extracellular solute-binding protein [Treponema sp.]|nr:extracellular solute-binding protein [Treponema sp.]